MNSNKIRLNSELLIGSTMGDVPENQDFGDEVSRLVEQAKDLQDSAAALINRTSREEEALRHRVASLDSRISSLRSSVRNSEQANRVRILHVFCSCICMDTSYC